MLRERTFSAAELLAACQARIEERNGGEPSFDGDPGAINAWARLYPEVAERAARAADERVAAEGAGAPLLCGIPLALKDLYAVEGLPLTASSRVLDGNVATETCVAWQRLEREGMVLVGHTHTHEFAAGGTTDQVGNPHAVDRTAGGSSGGSAAALAAGMVPAALGTDTAGSLRIPAALCGVSSFKATHGRVPIRGIIPLAPSLDHAGPMARSLADCAALTAALVAGGAEVSPVMPPPAAMGELPLGPRDSARPLEGLTVALTDRTDAEPVEEDVLEGLERARRACEQLGARVVSLPAAPEVSGPEYSSVFITEIRAYHEQHAGRLDRYREALRELMELARGFGDVDRYIAGQARRAELAAGWERWFADHGVDVLLEPTVPMTAQPRGAGYDAGAMAGEGDPLIRFTANWNATGFPVAALPAGLGARTGLPVGVSLVAPRGAEARVLQAGIDLQERELPPVAIAG